MLHTSIDTRSSTLPRKKFTDKQAKINKEFTDLENYL